MEPGLSYAEWLNMGGYGGYIWPAYATAAAILLGITLLSLYECHKTRRTLARLNISDHE